MKTVTNRITPSFLSVVTIFFLSLLTLTGCEEDEVSYSVEIESPADGTTFESGDIIDFKMSLVCESPALGIHPIIRKGTVIQWTSDKDGDFWKEEVSQDVEGMLYAFYHQEFSYSTFSAGDHTITCRAYRAGDSGTTQTLTTAKVRIYITESQGTNTTTTTATGGGGEGDNQSIAECSAMDRITLYAGAPEMYGKDCYANLYVKNKTDECVNVISCQYDTHDSEINGCWNSSMAGGAEIYLIDSGWITATMSDGSKRTRKTTDVWAYNCSKECAWIGNDLYNRVIDLPIPTTDVEGMNPCN